MGSLTDAEDVLQEALLAAWRGLDGFEGRASLRSWLTNRCLKVLRDRGRRIQVHFTPTSGSWLNLVEVWFGIIERQAVRRGSSAPSATSTPRSANSSPAGNSGSTRSSGPRPPTTSWPNSNVRRLH
jgi:DNA-directed RNA polymerase specialized sigma24 family protein